MEFGPLDKINESLVQSFVNRKLREGLSQKSVRDIVVVLKMILRYGAKKGLLEYPQMDIRFPKEEPKPRVEVLSLESQRELMAYLRDNLSFRNLGICLCLSAGLRIGEMCALKWGDIDMDSGILRVSRTLQRIYLVSESERRTLLLEDSPKTENAVREVPLTRELAAILRPFRKIVRADYYVVTNGAAPIEPRAYRDYFSKLILRLGLPKMRFHALRHSFATRCIESRCDYKTVSALLGHADIRTTLNLYVHPSMEQKRKCIAAMSRALK